MRKSRHGLADQLSQATRRDVRVVKSGSVTLGSELLFHVPLRCHVDKGVTFRQGWVGWDMKNLLGL